MMQWKKTHPRKPDEDSDSLIIDKEMLRKTREEMEARIKELEEVISILETTTPKWISVKDRLPPEGKFVIAFSPHGVFPAYYESYSNKDFAWWIDGNPVCNVTHWMPLPPPPTTEEK